MFLHQRLVVLTLSALLIFVIGCSGGSNITSPSNTDEMDSIPVIGLTQAGDTFSATGLFGAYEVNVNLDNMSVDLVPMRTPAVGEAYTVSGIGFFTMVPCATCLTWTGVSWTPEEYIKLDFAIRHPFQPGVGTSPPSAKNRNDLDVFDLAAVIVPGTTAAEWTQIGVSMFPGVVNASAYTSELQAILGGTAIYPYYLVVDDELDDDNTNNRFAMGAEDTFSVYFNPDPTYGGVTFDMYLTMGYGASAKKAQRLTPKYFLPEFNRHQAWKVIATPPQGDDPPAQSNTWKDDDSTAEWPVHVAVYDWQLGATVWDGTGNYSDAADDAVFAASEVGEIKVSIPGVTSAVVSVTDPTAEDGTGAPDDPAIFDVPVTNGELAEAGEYQGLVAVIDNRAPGDPLTTGRDFLIDSPDGIALDNYVLPEYATYATFTATVVPSCGPVTGSITSPTCPITNAGNSTTINFVVNASSANGGNPITLYECDYDYDGTTFTSDFSNTTGTLNNVGPFTVASPCESNIPHDFIVAFRATDSCAVPNATIFATCTVTVNSCCSYSELMYNFDSCTTLSTTCGDWVAGGCGLANTDGYNNWGNFKWGCNGYGTSCTGISGGMLTTAGDGMTCSWMSDTGPNCNYNVVSPSFTIPSASDSFLEWDACLSLAAAGGAFNVYVSTSGCSGSWTQIGNYTTSGCQVNQQIPITSYTGSNIMFRFQYSSSSGYTSGSCGQAGVVLDNVRVAGTWCGGTLIEN